MISITHNAVGDVTGIVIDNTTYSPAALAALASEVERLRAALEQDALAVAVGRAALAYEQARPAPGQALTSADGSVQRLRAARLAYLEALAQAMEHAQATTTRPEGAQS